MTAALSTHCLRSQALHAEAASVGSPLPLPQELERIAGELWEGSGAAAAGDQVTIPLKPSLLSLSILAHCCSSAPRLVAISPPTQALFALPGPEDVLQALAEDLEDMVADLARETPAQAALLKSARAAASTYLVTFSGPYSSNAVSQRPRRLSASGATALQRRRRSSVDAGGAAFAAVRYAYAGAIAASRRVNATALLVAASDEVAELDWLQFAGGSAAAIVAGGDAQVRAHSPALGMLILCACHRSLPAHLVVFIQLAGSRAISRWRAALESAVACRFEP